MSWGEVEKINSWAKKGVPLNHLIWLQDYKTYGESSYVFRHKDILHELYNSFKISMNDTKLKLETFEYIMGVNNNVGPAIGAIYGAPHLDWSAYQTLESVLDSSEASSEAFKFLAEQSDLMDIICNREDIINSYIENENFVVVAVNYEGAVNTISSSTALMDKVTKSARIMNAICKSNIAIKTIDNASIQNYADNLAVAYSDESMFEKQIKSLATDSETSAGVGPTICIVTNVAGAGNPSYHWSAYAQSTLNNRRLAYTTYDKPLSGLNAIALGGVHLGVEGNGASNFISTMGATVYTAL